MEKQNFNFISVPYKLDRKLYKYYGNISNAISNLKNKRIHLDYIGQFNDPFEALVVRKNYASWVSKEKFNTVFKNIIEYITKARLIKKSYLYEKVFRSIVRLQAQQEIVKNEDEFPINEIVQMIYDRLRGPSFSYYEFCETIECGYLESNPFSRINCKMSCFSEVNDSLLMWSYYANKHCGVCVEYDLSLLDLEDEFNKKIYQSISRVHYSRHRADTLIDFPIDDTYLNLLLTKADVWSHEREWRLICETDEEFLPLSCASAIYIGATVSTESEKYRDIIDAVNTYDNMKVYKAKLDPEKYQLNFEEICDTRFRHMFQKQNNKNK